MTFAEIKEKINSLFPGVYSDVGISAILQELIYMDPKIRIEFENFLNGKPYKSLKFSGYDIKRLEAEHNMNSIAAFLTLDWIKKNPDDALASLKRGHDKVIKK